MNGGRKIDKKYSRNRTENLSLRLTAEEKDLLRGLAKKNRLSLTSYILLSALQYSSADPFRALLKELDTLREELVKAKGRSDADAIVDALEKQSEVYEKVLAAIRCA